MSLSPPVPYFGGKQRIADRVVGFFPSHQHYVEPFAGGLSVLLAKPPSALETVNDLDGDVMTFWRILRDQPDDLARVCGLTPHGRAEYQASYDRPEDLTDLERARRIWVQLTQGRAGTLRKTGWRFYADAAGTTMGMPAALAGYIARLVPAAARLANVSLECRPALEVIATYNHPGTLLYVDPPYLRETRSGLGYRHEMPDEADHRELAEILNATSASVVLSGYRSALYDELYDGWLVHEIGATTGQGSVWKDRTEVLWSNRAPQGVLDFGEMSCPASQ
jgi:DNA adenine methylase